jgi:hypothetical protein
MFIKKIYKAFRFCADWFKRRSEITVIWTKITPDTIIDPPSDKLCVLILLSSKGEIESRDVVEFDGIIYWRGCGWFNMEFRDGLYTHYCILKDIPLP